jgi:hypothetical protein
LDPACPHPLVLAAMLEHAWSRRANDAAKPVGHPDHRSDVAALPDVLLNPVLTALGFPVRAPGSRWDHLIYAHMIENTGVYEIFQRVLHRYVHGNLEGVTMSPASVTWLRTTEELFYHAPASFSITSFASDIRPDLRATRRNAYWRMFGMDLIHGAGGNGKPYAYEKPPVANTEFKDAWKQFLTEVWVGITNVGNSSGTNPTDDASISDFATKLHEMLRARRRNGQLAREEFYAVATMSWFHLALEFDSPIIADLGASGSGPVERLIKIASRAGENVPEAQREKLDSFFDLADPMSRILTLIEAGTSNTSAAVPVFYLPGPTQADMKEIIRAWSLATGEGIKAGALPASRPTRVLVPA